MRSFAWPVVASICALCTVSAAESEPRREMLLKVFLADFEDIPHPDSYTREYFDRLFFGLGEPRQTPEGRRLAGSVREYFLNVSEGRLDVGGEVTEWVRIPRQITQIPHWKGGMEPFGESWPVIVAETLRAHGIVGAEAEQRVRLADGRSPDLLVFLNTDWGVGGVNRGWDRLKEVLDIMGLGGLWDDAWTRLPSPYSSYSATIWRGAPPSDRTGVIDRVPSESDLELFPLSIMIHEMGHQLAGWPDLYGPSFEPWGVFDIMGGPAASTHFSMAPSSYLRESSGWMAFTDVPPRSQRGLELWPLDTHKTAFRFPQGPDQESVIAENRAYLVYPADYGIPPENRGQRLLLYRLDPNARRVMMYGDQPCRRITTVIRRPEHYGEMWGEGAANELTGGTMPSSRNSLGELWWEFRNVMPGAEGQVRFDAERLAADLIERYAGAEWTGDDAAPIEAGVMGRRGGQVAIRSVTQSDGKHQRRLHLEAPAGGAVGGVYHLPSPLPQRLYLVAEAVGGASAPAALVVSAGEAESRFAIVPDLAGPHSLFIIDVPASAEGIRVVVEAPTDRPAEIDIEQAWLVGLPPVALDCVDDTADGPSALLDGGCYGPRVLSVPLAGEAPDTWRREWPIAVPAGPTVLRGLIGFMAGAPAGARARVAIKLVGPDREWPLISNLEMEAAGGGDSAAMHPTVIEQPIPGDAAGTDATLVLEADGTPGTPSFRLAVPVLQVCLAATEG